MITLRKTSKFSVYVHINDSSHQPSLPPLTEYIGSALREYHHYVPDDCDWDIFEACAISLREQRLLNPENEKGTSVLTYGEINFECIAEVLYYLKKDQNLPGGCTFYDLGSGTGKVVLAAAVLHDFRICCGIEFLQGLHAVALGYGNAWDASHLISLTTRDGNSSGETETFPKLEYICGSIIDEHVKNWALDADVVFSNTHCFDENMMISLSRIAAKMKPGSYFISTTVILDENLSGGFKIIKRFNAEMSWGIADGYILQKPASIRT